MQLLKMLNMTIEILRNVHIVAGFSSRLNIVEERRHEAKAHSVNLSRMQQRREGGKHKKRD